MRSAGDFADLRNVDSADGKLHHPVSIVDNFVPVSPKVAAGQGGGMPVSRAARSDATADTAPAAAPSKSSGTAFAALASGLPDWTAALAKHVTSPR